MMFPKDSIPKCLQNNRVQQRSKLSRIALWLSLIMLVGPLHSLVHAGSDIDPDTLQELNERQVIEVMWQAWKHSDGHLVHEIAPLVLTQLSLNPNRFYAVVAPDSTGFDLFLQLMESTCFRNWDDTVTSHMRRYKRYILNLLSNAKKMMISI